MSEPDQIDMMSEADVRAALRDVVAQNVDLQRSLATAERERDDAIRANHSVSVCKDHTVDITGPGCVVCDLYNTAGERSQLRVKLEAAERELAELRREVDILRLYGNKDCTAMADEELARIHNPSRGEP